MLRETNLESVRAERAGGRLSTRDYVSSAFRYKWVMGGVFVFVAGSMALLTFVLPEIYESNAKVLVKLGRESLFSSDPAVSLVGPKSGGSGGGATTNIGYEVNSQVELLQNTYLAERVVERIGVDAFLGETEEANGGFSLARWIGGGDDASEDETLTAKDRAVRQFMANLDVSAQLESSIITLTYESKNAKLAQQTLGTLIDEYLEHNIRVHGSQTSPDFFNDRVDEARACLEAKEAELKQFQSANGLTGDPSVQQNGHEDAIADLKVAIADAKSEAGSALARSRALENALKGRTRMTVLSEVSGDENRAAETLKEDRVDLLRRLTELEALHPSDHRLVRSAREELRLVEEALAQEADSLRVVTTGVDQNYETLMQEFDMAKADLESSIARTELLEEELGRREAGLTALIESTGTLAQLQREVDLLQEEYLDYRANQRVTEVHAALDRDRVSNLSVAQPASLPVKPVRPNKLLNLAAGIVLGLLAAAGLGFTLFLLDDSIKTSEDVETHLEIPVLASITDGDYKKCI